MKYIKPFLLLLGLAATLFVNTSFCTKEKPIVKILNKSATTISDSMPVPKGFTNQLFYVQRTINTNTILYELNVDKSGKINKENPIHIFWVRYASDSSTAELSYIQRKYAYGINVKLIDAEKESYKLNFVSYENRDLYLIKSTIDKKYHIYTTINGKLGLLNNVFVKIEGGTFWFPKVTSVELYGKDLTNSKTVYEKFKP